MPAPEENGLVAALRQIPPHSHVCTVYETVAEQQAAAMAFLRIGIERSEKGVYIADAGGEHRARSVMRAHGIDVERALASDALFVTTSDRAYLHRGVFEPERMWAFWKDAARLAQQQGFASARCIGETDWLVRGAPGVERWKEYESRLGDVALECRCSILCPYNRRLPSRMIRDAIRSHALVVYRGALCRSMYYEPAHVPDPQRRERDVDRMLEHILSREVVEEELRRAYARNTEILESITDAFTAFDRDWRFVYVNERAVQLLGKPRQELIGRVVWELFTEGIGMDHYYKFQQAMNERVPLVFDGHSPSTGRWYTNHVYPTPDGLACYWSDITEIRRAQDELRRGAAYLAEGQRISHTGSWAWNVASGEIFWSLEHFRICGLDPAAFKPHIETASRIIHPDDLPAARQAFDEATRQRRDYAWQFRVLRPDGTIRQVRSVGHPVFDSAGELTEYVGTIADITEQKQAEEAVNAARAELAHVNRALTMGEFAASIAHELNQPLAAIVTDAAAGARWLGSAPPNTGEAADSLRRIGHDAARASEVIVRIRELLARRQSQKAELRIEDVIRDVMLLLERDVRAQAVQFDVALAVEGLPAVIGDRVQLQQVVLNLVLNAFDAMSAIEGPRRLELRAESFDHDTALVSISDSGVGVEPELASRMFDAFFSTKSDGMGMGLAISRSIVEAHGGRLWVSSNDGPGATLRFTLPVRRHT